MQPDTVCRIRSELLRGNTTDQAFIQVDPGWFTHIVFNLVGNVLRFSNKGQTKIIDLGYRLQRDSAVLFSVRDYGPGIGLALVQQLASALNGQVAVFNAEPGAEFRVSFYALDQNTVPSTR